MLMDERPPYVKFKQVAVKDPEATRKNGHVSYKNEDHVEVMPFGTKDVFEGKASVWLKEQEKRVKDKRIPAKFYEYYMREYEAYKAGEGEVINGTSVKLWPAISPAEVQALLNANVRTIEDLACAPEVTLQTIGMGARGLQRKAKAWLESARTTGVSQEKITDLEQKLEYAINSINDREAVINDLQTEIRHLTLKLEGKNYDGRFNEKEGQERLRQDAEEEITGLDDADNQPKAAPKRRRRKKSEMVA